MELQYTFYDHIVEGFAGKDGPLLARIALHLGYDADAYPVRLLEIGGAGQLPRDIRSYGLNEVLLGEYLKTVAVDGAKPWTNEEVARLSRIAGIQPKAKLYAIPNLGVGPVLTWSARSNDK